MTTHVLEREVFIAPRVLKSHALWQYPRGEKRSYGWSFMLSAALHILILLAGAAAFVKPAEYGIAPSEGGMEIYMVAALPEETTQGTELKQLPEPSEERPEMEIPVPEPLAPGEEKAEEKEDPSTALSRDKEHVGDGSSPSPGESSTTFASSGEAWVDARAGYLKNPPPRYPRESIARGEEGLVVLSVTVNKTGRAENVAVKETSGFSLLDQSALKAVKGWKFNPGKLGFMAADSKLLVPIRFRIEDVVKSRLH